MLVGSSQADILAPLPLWALGFSRLSVQALPVCSAPQSPHPTFCPPALGPSLAPSSPALSHSSSLSGRESLAALPTGRFPREHLGHGHISAQHPLEKVKDVVSDTLGPFDEHRGNRPSHLHHLQGEQQEHSADRSWEQQVQERAFDQGQGQCLQKA